jgi:hypothetical protein
LTAEEIVIAGVVTAVVWQEIDDAGGAERRRPWKGGAAVNLTVTGTGNVNGAVC